MCMDGAAAMLGAHQGFNARVTAVIVIQCLLHRENLVSWKLSLELNYMMEDVIQKSKFN